MKDISYFLMKVHSKLSSNPQEVIANYFRNRGMHIGKGCNICSNILTTESYLVYLGNNVTIAGEVLFVTHDNSISKVLDNTTDLFGEIHIGDSCFIGNRAIIMYGVSLSDHIIVAAGSVVTKSFPEPGVIIGGNPARVIGSCDEFASRNQKHAFNLDIIGKDDLQRTIDHSDKLVKK